ncbi:galactose-3-O-sulfotransferase 2 [Lingula anatina]|uniref:Galactose-3-O-sulfotransferase 2 n=1 Tax=Lingula anatina TaxID=7574 RepID=A0A1S3J7W4_LINAN|nr:galactose-3-O-sulfotransferase 2 [Lingula anatina]|eukprot:XP_013406497.1 galactose-3-O-sulfotransferase 2 [Lingula anatina]
MPKGGNLFTFLSRLRWQLKATLLFLLTALIVRLGWVIQHTVTSSYPVGKSTSAKYLSKMASSNYASNLGYFESSISHNESDVPLILQSPVINMTSYEEADEVTVGSSGVTSHEKMSKISKKTDPPQFENMKITSHPDDLTTLSSKTECKNTWSVKPKGKPASKIVFLKTHKAASSTVQNIFLRYALERNLTIALGFKELDSAQLGWPHFFRKDFAYPSTKGTYDIMCHHMRYSENVATVMPSETIYITVIRDPVQLFQSYFFYYQLDRQFKIAGETDPLETFSKNPGLYEHKWEKVSPVRNVMMFDLGLKKEYMNDENMIEGKIKEIEQRFHIVLIAEYFDESLILMRDLLNWSNHDILYFKQNIMSNTTKRTISDATKHRLEQWNKADVMLYQYFIATFWANAKKFCLEKLAAEVNAFRSQLKQWQSDCVLDVITGNKMYDPLYKTYNPNALSYRLRPGGHGNETCVNLAKTEIAFTEEMLNRMKKTKSLNFDANYAITIKKGSPEEKELLKRLAAIKG